VAQRVRLRQAPEISVRYDDTSERAARVSAVINSLSIPPAEDEAPSAS
jgi:ribosome-binding factor A